MTYYNCKRDGDLYRITKFTEDMDVESSYLTSHEACGCPAGHRSVCRHRIMLPRFIAHEATEGQYFFDYDASKWIRASVEESSVEILEEAYGTGDLDCAEGGAGTSIEGDGMCKTADEAAAAMAECDYWNGRKSLGEPREIGEDLQGGRSMPTKPFDRRF